MVVVRGGISVHVRLINRAASAQPDAACTPIGDWANGCWTVNASRCYTAISHGGYDHCVLDYAAGCTYTDACIIDA